MKRDRSGEDRSAGEVVDIHDSIADTANCLMLLSKVGSNKDSPTGLSRRVFTCKTCNREFSSFQALGGHRASHKKPRLLGDGTTLPAEAASNDKPKTHQCSICGLEFPIGQALGGHMRRHRNELATAASPAAPMPRVPVLKKSSSSKRVTLCLDLNLSPLENDLRLMLLGGKLAPAVTFVI